MLNKKPDKSLVRAERRPVNAKRRNLFTLVVFVNEPELCRNREINLISGKREFLAYGAPDLNIYFGTVKCRLIRHFRICHAAVCKRLKHHSLGLLPKFRLIHIFFAESPGGMPAETHHILFYAEDFKIIQVHFNDSEKFVFKLFK